MRTEAQRSFLHGFVLSEQELRRIVDLIAQQLTKASSDAITQKFELRFRNGAVAETSSIDDVLSQENMGGSAIVRLGITMSIAGDPPPWSVQVDFINADVDDSPGATSVRYKIAGDERDWVFVTSSQLEERIRRVRRFAPNQMLLRRNIRAYIPLVFLALMIVPLVLATRADRKATVAAIDSLQVAHRAGRLADPVDALLAAERIRAVTQAGRLDSVSITNPFVLVGAPLVALVVIGTFWASFFPLFTFAWGDNLAYFNRRQAIGRFILGAVVIGFLIGIVANAASRKLGF